MTKTERQSITYDKIKENDFNGILHLCVRFGKTRIGLRVYKERTIDKHSSLILVPSSNIKTSWLKEDAITYKLNPTIATTNQLLNIGKRFKVDTLIVDEGHKYLGEESYRLINGELITYNKIIILTGTLPIEPKLSKLTKLAPVIDKITEQEAVSNNWVSNFIEYNIPLELSDNDKYKYVELTAKLANIFNKYKNIYNRITIDKDLIFTNDLELINGCVYGKYSKKYGHITSDKIRETVLQVMRGGKEDDDWNLSLIEVETRQFTFDLKNRNNIVVNNRIKLNAVLHIFNVLNRNTICFNESIPFTDLIARTINNLHGDIAISYHSKLESKPLINPETKEYYTYKTGKKAGEPKIFSKTKQLEYAIAGIEYGIIKFISTAKALDEGITIPQIDCVITTSGSMNPIQYEQRVGRGKTFVDTSKVTKIYNLYFDDFELEEKEYKSRDKIKLLSRQQNSFSVHTLPLSDI